MNKVLNTLSKYDKEFYIGYEVECILDGKEVKKEFFNKNPTLVWENYHTALRAEPFIKKACKKYIKDITFSGDSSVRCLKGNFPIEIKTLPKRPSKALDLLETLFIFIKNNGYTNHTCGLHLNISCSKKNTPNIHPVYLSKSPLWKDIKKKFKRDSNLYCGDVPLAYVPKDKQSYIDSFNRHMIGKNHYDVISFKSWNFSQKLKHSRIEIRAMGNINYEKKFPLVKEYTIKSMDEFLASMKYKDPIVPTKENPTGSNLHLSNDEDGYF